MRLACAPRRTAPAGQPAALADGRPAFANPVLIGAVTVLIAIIAVFLAYNANTGLPFVPTRELKVDIANGSTWWSATTCVRVASGSA